MNLSFEALGKTVDVDFDSASQHMVVYFDNREIAESCGDIIQYPREIQTGIVRGAAADAWERKQIKEIAEQILAEKVISDEQ